MGYVLPPYVRSKEMRNELKNHRLLLDGAMGTMVQEYRLCEEDFRGELFRDVPVQLKGNNDVLVLTRPDIVYDIHKKYLAAGADIITTDTFSSQRVSQKEYRLEDYVVQLNREAVRIAQKAIADYEEEQPESRGRHFVLGDVGPTSRMLSMSDDVSNPAARSITFDELFSAYEEQIETLVESGVDGIMIETAFDTLNVKAAIAAYRSICRKYDEEHAGTNAMLLFPLFISMTVSDASGRILSGQTIEAFVDSVIYCQPLSIGMNCGMGAEAMIPYLRRMRKAVNGRCYVSCHPNAGLPNQFGEYDDTPEEMVSQIAPIVTEGLAEILGGCCGTTPEHIRSIRKLCDDIPYTRIVFKNVAENNTPVVVKDVAENDTPASVSENNTPDSALCLSGLESFSFGKKDFIVVGERCNVAGSRKFLRLVNEKKYDEAIDIARTQVEHGAMVVDVNMDDGLLDAEEEMTTFLNLLMSDPSVCRVPVMIDSSRFSVIERGLKCCQGKCIVNSISLKQGEETFLRNAKVVKDFGGAVVVMLFDEEGQATDYSRRIAIAERAYRLLVEKAGMKPEDIIFDPNVLTIATGIEEHRNYARDFIKATKWISENLPGARISGGLSNLSFAFRGNNYLREAMHTVFLHHAIEAGMNMAIMNPMTAIRYEEIPEKLCDAITAVILNTSDDAAEQLVAMASQLLAEKEGMKVASKVEPKQEKMSISASDRIVKALVEGNSATLESDLRELTEGGMSALEVVSGPLMEGMNTVGRLFGEGRMFLPQVVKTARTMKKAVDILLPAPESSEQTSVTEERVVDAEKRVVDTEEQTVGAGTVLLATVKGDVHDIGKNIVGVVMACNGFRTIDLGVMVEADRIVAEAIRTKADIVCLSGLITPSLDEMCRVAEAMQKAGLTVPLFVGGATTSEIHTAVKIAPLYGGGVFHMRDASQNPVVAMALLNADQREETLLRNRSRQQRIRMAQQRKEQLLRVQRATSDALGEPTPLHRRFTCNWNSYVPVRPPFIGRGEVRRIPLKELIPCIDWLYFYWAWRVKEDSEEGRLLKKDAEELLMRMAENNDYDICAMQAFYPARGTTEAIELGITRIHTPRQAAFDAHGRKREQCLALCDYVSPNGNDYIGVFAATVSPFFVEEIEHMKKEGTDDYETILLQTLGDRLAEAASEYLSRELAEGECHWMGIRPAVGYPSLPDQKAIFSLDALIHYSDIGITLTENGAMYPQASVTGIYLSHPEAVYFNV